MPGGGRADTSRHRKRRLSKRNTFPPCARLPSAVDDEESRIGGPRFSRVVRVNGAAAVDGYYYRSNKISTTKYSSVTILTNSLFEKFRPVAIIYFLITALLSYTPVAPFRGSTAVAPLVLLLVATMVKEAIEDWRRKQQDVEVNNRKVKVFQDGAFTQTKWTSLRVGDVVKVEKDDFFPADLILLSSSYGHAMCLVETMDLDGKTNLDFKQALDVTSHLQNDDSFGGFGAVIRCEDPNGNLDSFVGNIEIEEQQHPLAPQQHPLSPQQLLLRDSKLRNTKYVHGAVIFTGHDTKVMQNATSVPSKRSNIEKKMDGAIYLLLCSLILISVIGPVVFGIATKDDLVDGRMKRWYLRPDDTTVVCDPNKVATSAALDLFTAMILYGYFILVSLYTSIDFVKLLQAMFINSDIHILNSCRAPNRAGDDLDRAQSNAPPAALGHAGHGVGFPLSYAAEARARTTAGHGLNMPLREEGPTTAVAGDGVAGARTIAGHGLNMPLREEGPTTDGRMGGDFRTAVAGHGVGFPLIHVEPSAEAGTRTTAGHGLNMPLGEEGPTTDGRTGGDFRTAVAGHGVGFPLSYAEPSAEDRVRTTAGHGLNMPLREEGPTTDGHTGGDFRTAVPYLAQSNDGLHAYGHASTTMPRSGAGPSNNERAEGSTSYAWPAAHGHAGHGVGFPLSYAEPSAEARPRTISGLGHGLNMPLREEGPTTGDARTRVAVVPYVAQSHDGLHAYGHAGTAMPEGVAMGRVGARTSHGSTLAQLMAGNSVIYDSDSDEGDHMLAEHYEEDMLWLTPMVPGHFSGLMPVHVQEAPPAVMEEPPAQNLWDRAQRYVAAVAAAVMWACGGTSGPRDMLRRGDN